MNLVQDAPPGKQKLQTSLVFNQFQWSLESKLSRQYSAPVFCCSLQTIFCLSSQEPRKPSKKDASVAGGTVFASARGISWTGTCTATLNTSGSLRTDLSRSAKEV